MKTVNLNALSGNAMCREKQHRNYPNGYLQILIYTVLFMVIAHGYRYVTFGFSHDSMVINSFMNNEWQISIGRFLQPVYLYIRGGVVAPYLVGLFSILWLSISTYLIIELLQPKKQSTIIWICGIMAINSTLSVSNATYIPWSDMFMLSLLFSVLGVYFFVKCKWGFIVAPFLFCASLALYQAYIQVAVLLLMVLLVLNILDGQGFQDILRSSLNSVGILFLGLIIYYFINKIALAITGITLVDSYNGLQDIGDYSSESIPVVFVKTYLHVARFFIMPETFNAGLSAAVNIIIIVFVLVMLVRLSSKHRIETRNKVLLGLIIIAMPFGANAVHFIAKFMHSLMTYSFVLFCFTYLPLCFQSTRLTTSFIMLWE